jgi:molecular chaperone DnaJ
MQYSQACKILGVEESATKEQINSRFRKISKEKHPDINKAPNAEDEYKQISAAYEFLKNYDPNKPPNPFSHDSGFQGGFGGFNFTNDFFRDFVSGSGGFSQPMPDGNIYKTINLSFKDSIIGCEQKIVVDRKVRCDTCGGRAKVRMENTCSKCGGIGRQEQTQRMGNQVFRTVAPCPNCFQTGKDHKACDTCNSAGHVDKTSEFSIKIPGGARNGSVLTLNNAGNFINRGNMFMQGSVILSINVAKDPDMWLEDNNDNVYSKINISLFEALSGAEKEVSTIDGSYKINIEPKVKHKDEIIIPKKGIRREADHRVIVNIDYPDNLDKLIEVLKPQE